MSGRSIRVSLILGLVALVGGGVAGCGKEDGQRQDAAGPAPEGNAPRVVSSDSDEGGGTVPPDPPTARHPLVGLWEAKVDELAAVVEGLPPESPGAPVRLRAAAASQWRIEQVKIAGNELSFDLARGGLIRGKVVRFRGTCDPDSGVIRGTILDGARSRDLVFRQAEG